jgi:hypothetical protein
VHYGDKEQIKHNKLTIVIYKHGTPRKNVFDYDLTSIQECKYFPKLLLKDMLGNTKKIFSKYFKDKKEEEWYEVKLTTLDGYKKIKINSIKNVSDTKNEFHRLH